MDSRTASLPLFCGGKLKPLEGFHESLTPEVPKSLNRTARKSFAEPRHMQDLWGNSRGTFPEPKSMRIPKLEIRELPTYLSLWDMFSARDLCSLRVNGIARFRTKGDCVRATMGKAKSPCDESKHVWLPIRAIIHWDMFQNQLVAYGCWQL